MEPWVGIAAGLGGTLGRRHSPPAPTDDGTLIRAGSGADMSDRCKPLRQQSTHREPYELACEAGAAITASLSPGDVLQEVASLSALPTMTVPPFFAGGAGEVVANDTVRGAAACSRADTALSAIGSRGAEDVSPGAARSLCRADRDGKDSAEVEPV
ncbi:MAG: hypothetical protein JW767_09625 [Thermoleophilia bacterium]|nr:hypothetical protein [Thermoleophilia bacterium]